MVRAAVEAADEPEAGSIIDVLLAKMGVVPAEILIFVRLDDGAWATEVHDARGFEEAEFSDPLSVLSCLTTELGPVTWLSGIDTPFDPESANDGKMEWPPGYWALAGRKEMLAHPSVRAVYLQAQRRHAT